MEAKKTLNSNVNVYIVKDREDGKVLIVKSKFNQEDFIRSGNLRRIFRSPANKGRPMIAQHGKEMTHYDANMLISKMHVETKRVGYTVKQPTSAQPRHNKHPGATCSS